jgi:hypothetical protein
MVKHDSKNQWRQQFKNGGNKVYLYEKVALTVNQ